MSGRESLLELQDFSAPRKSSSGGSRRSGGGRNASDDEDGEDVPATVSVLPLLANAAAAQPSDSAHYSYAHGGSSSSSSSSAEHKESVGPRGRDAASESASGPIVVAHNVHKTYLLGVEGVPALRGVSLSIDRGEWIMILGSSGGGKTSLLNILGTIDKPTKGELHICGHKITAGTTDEEFAYLRLKRIGFVFQTFNLLPSMTAEENVSLPMILEGRLSAAEIKERARELLERVGLGERLDHLPSQLSGGEQQRVTIARAIANKPSILLLDEPTGDLDQINGTLILSLLLHLNRADKQRGGGSGGGGGDGSIAGHGSPGMTLIMVTHDKSLQAYAHRVVHMVDGKVARLETIDPQRRADMDAKLAQRVAQIRGEWSGEIPAAQAPTTEYRDADDYEAFLRADEDDED